MNQNKKLRLVKELQSLSDNPRFFANDGEEFEGDKNCIIWTGNEEAFHNGLEIIYGMYCEKVNPVFQKFLDDNKLYFERYDGGTVMIYEDE